MPYYIVLLNWTDQGIRTIKDLPKRLKKSKAIIEKAGGKWQAIYFTFGQYDAVGVAEFPNDEAAASALLFLGTQGNIRTTTLKAFTQAEFVKIIGKLP
ncbi:MAG: GYD domain-containing protein [Nitrososphaerales archaeon]|nr:GYD domain-containing protein [Nitrososphaerales archaeon]